MGIIVVKYFEKFGFFGLFLIFGYGVWMCEEDIEIVVVIGMCVCYNCLFNFCFCSGVLFFMELEKRGMMVGLGIDEVGINDDWDMF